MRAQITLTCDSSMPLDLMGFTYVVAGKQTDLIVSFGEPWNTFENTFQKKTLQTIACHAELILNWI